MPFCSAIRASKQATAYHDKMVHILKENPNLKPVFVTLTVRNGDDLKERFNHLKDSFKVHQSRRRDWLKKVVATMNFVRLTVSCTPMR